MRAAVAISMLVGVACVLTAAARAEPPGAPDVVPPPNAIVEQPRPFGHVVGDLLVQRVLLELHGDAFVPAALPQGERINAWLERRPARVDETADGRRWLVLEYQVVNAPQALALVRIPALALSDKSGTRELRIGEWPISVSPLTPRDAFDKGGLEALRPDHPPPAIPTEPLRRQLAISLSALTATLALWGIWLLWRNWRSRSAQPFAGALREMRRLDERSSEAWQVLHRAFDRTAGRVVQMATLPGLFQRAPYLTQVRPQIERFFAESNERFFGAGAPGDAVSVRDLCAQLRRLEKSQER
jgi:mxaA protein